MWWRFSQLAGWLSVLILTTTAFTTVPHDPAVKPASIQQPSSFQSALARINPAGVYVRAVLFWTPDCRFCRQVVEQDLPPVIEPFGQQLQILYIDLNVSNGEVLYQAALQQFGVAQSGIPMLVIDQTVLQGTLIAQQLPGLVEEYLKNGGVDWPAIPGLETWLDALPEIMSQPLGTAQCSECELSATRVSAMITIQASQRLQATAEAKPEYPVVRAVMFWMSGCPHCHEVLNNVLPPIQAKYGEQFQIHLIELVGGQEVVALYDLAESMGIAKENVGVPFLIIGEHVLVGSDQIPAELPGLIEKYLAAGGVDFPDSPALTPLLPTLSAADKICSSSTPCPETPQTTPELSTPLAQLPTETVAPFPLSADAPARSNGFTLAVVVMAGMVMAVIYSGLAFVIQSQTPISAGFSPWMNWASLVLTVIGLGVAGYLAYVETQAATAICGPLGDCNAVQHSPYARLFGVLPIGVLGVIGYLTILAAWIIRRMRQARWANLAALATFGMAFVGTLFSLYLTYLEPFVIQAVCMWCITSAVIMTWLLLLNLKPAVQAIKSLNRLDDSTFSERESNAEEKTP